MTNFRQLTCLFTVILLISACSPRVAEMVGTEAFSESSATAEDVLPTLNIGFDSVHSLTGRANARVSSPEFQEQATLSFTSDRERSLLTMRNNLGIEGGRILADPDSVLMFDRIERRAWKMSTGDSHRILLNGFSAFNVIEFLMPQIAADDVINVMESDEEWLLEIDTGARLFFSKSDGLLRRMTKQADQPASYNRFLFSSHAGIDGYTLPRRIQILSNDEKSTIFLLIQALELNPSALSFDIGIPDDIPIERI